MSLRIEALDARTTRLVLQGRLDAAGCDRVESAFTAAVGSAPGHVLVDLGAVEYVGSLGIRLLISSARNLQRRGRSMILYAVQPQPADVFETVAIADLIPVAGTEAEARGLLPGG